jgi:hypothetical protein
MTRTFSFKNICVLLIIIVAFSIFIVGCSINANNNLLSNTQISNAPTSVVPIDSLEDSVYFSKEKRLTDKVLQLTIDDGVKECFDKDTKITISLEFHNLTSQVLFLQANMVVPPNKFTGVGSIIPLFYDVKGELLLELTDTFTSDYPFYTENYTKIQAYGIYKTMVDIDFPNEVLIDYSSNDLRTIPTDPGRYNLKILYLNYLSDSPQQWSGMISSNIIDFCIK